MQAFAQIELSGSVIEKQTGEPLPSATILQDGTYRGTVTNAEGKFTLTVDSFPATLIIRYIGFDSMRFEVYGLEDLPVKAELEPSITELGEIIVTDKDPGLSIMERVIERKKIWRESLQSYKVSAYTRQSLSNDTSIVSILESSSVAFWDRERGHREVQLSRIQTANFSEDQNFAGVRYQPNFYDDNIEIAGYNMVGITHPNATSFYHFRLMETQQMDGKPLYKIEVIPRRGRQPLFEGTAWVLGRNYALLEVDLKPNDVVNFPPPVQDFDLSYKQQFSNFGGQYWLPVDMRVEGLIRIAMIGLRFPAIQFRQSSRLTDYEINISLPDSIYQNTNELIRADSLYSSEKKQPLEPIPLTTEEELAYENIDSTATLEEIFKPEGFLARAVDSGENDDENGFLSGAGDLFPQGISFRGRYNRMDGLHIGLGYGRTFNDTGFRFNAFGGHSFHSNLWDYGLTVKQRLIETQGTTIRLETGYKNTTDTRYSSNLYGTGLTGLVTVLGGVDYFDYYRNKKLYAGLNILNLLQKTDVTVFANREKQSTFHKLAVENYSLFGWHKTRRINPAISDGTLHSLKTELKINEQSNDFGISGGRQIILSAEFSSDSFGSDFNFTKLDASLDWNFQTFYKRRLFANSLDFHLSAGTSFGTLPLQKYGIIDGTLNKFTPFGVLRTRKFLPYEGTDYWLATAEHNFRTIPFEILGLDWLVDNGWGIILFGGAGETNAEKNQGLPELMLTGGIHSEAGISLNSVFGILRIDFAKRLDKPGTFIGVSLPRYF